MLPIKVTTKIIETVKCYRLKGRETALSRCLKCKFRKGQSCNAGNEIDTIGFAVGEKYMNNYFPDYTFEVTVVDIKKGITRRYVEWWIVIEGLLPDGTTRRHSLPLKVAKTYLKKIELDIL